MSDFNPKTFFLPYQIRWLKDESRIKIWEKSRRIGASYVQAYEDVRDCVTKKYFRKNKPLSVWFSSADLSAAKEYILYCKEFATLFQEIATDLGEIIIDPEKDVKAFCIEFRNGARIHALSSNPTQFRSKGGKVILDEMAHHDNQDELWKAANASAFIWGYPIRILSTHNGQNCKFFKFIEKVKKGELDWSLHTTSIQMAVDEGLADKIFERELTKEERQEFLESVRKNAGDEITWTEEYCCIAVDEATAFLPYDLIDACESDNVLCPLDKTTGDLYLGFDIARKKHLSVITVFEKLGDVKYTRNIIELKNMKFSHQEEVLYKILGHKRLRRACIDQTGIGMQLAEKAQDKFGKHKVEGITFTGAMKEELAYNLYTTFEDRKIRNPKDQLLREDLHSVRKVPTKSGNVRFDVDSSDTDGHADRFWSIALANHAVGKSKGGARYFTSRRKRESYNLLRGYKY